MKWLIGNVISFFSQVSNRTRLSKPETRTELIVSGYVHPLDKIDNGTTLPEPLHRKQAAVLYADIAGYARLTEQDEEGTHRRLVEAVRVMMTHISNNEGRIAHLAGDAILAEFKDADSALHCAVNVQMSARQWNANLDLDRQILFRIGVNFGDVITNQGDIYGNAVNLAARLEKLASSGGICISESIMEKLENHPSLRFVATGKQYVKNISEPVHAFWIEVDSERLVESSHTSAIKVSAVNS